MFERHFQNKNQNWKINENSESEIKRIETDVNKIQTLKEKNV